MPLPKAGGGKADVQLSAMSGKNLMNDEKRSVGVKYQRSKLRLATSVALALWGVQEGTVWMVEHTSTA